MNNIFSSNKRAKPLDLKWSGELRFGPPHYSISIYGDKIENRDFFEDFIWSPNGKYLAISEYKYDTVNKNYKSFLVIFDVEKKIEATISSIQNGFIKPIAFETNNNKIVYIKEPLNNISREYEYELFSLKKWKKY